MISVIFLLKDSGAIRAGHLEHPTGQWPYGVQSGKLIILLLKVELISKLREERVSRLFVTERTCFNLSTFCPVLVLACTQWPEKHTCVR